MTFQQVTQTLGLDPAVLYAGAGGGLLRAMSRRQLRLREILLSPGCGALAAAYLTPPAIQYAEHFGLPVPADTSRVLLAFAFLIGTSAMWLCDFLFNLVSSHLRTKFQARDGQG